MTDTYLSRDAINADADIPDRTKTWLLEQHDSLDKLEVACARLDRVGRILSGPPIHPQLPEIARLAAQLRALIKLVPR